LAVRKLLGASVFDLAVERLAALYEQGHRLVVSFSGGKDSCCTLESAILAARVTNRLPVDVVLQDEEIAYPGTYEYAERVAQRSEVSFNWLLMHQPMVNCYNRVAPYFWVHDLELQPSRWVREPPSSPECHVQEVNEKDICRMTVPERFPPLPGKELYAVLGLRVQESRGRLYGLFQSKGHVTKPNKFGVRSVRPIYDWRSADVWKAIKDNHWDYNHAYDTFHSLGVKAQALRIGPPTMNAWGIDLLTKAAQAWPSWFDRVCRRLPGVRTAAMFGQRSVQATRRMGESWEECFTRVCIADAPVWIRERATRYRDIILHMHAHHATTSFPEVRPCHHCQGNNGSWKGITLALYNGDPFSTRAVALPYVEPDFFRAGAGKWSGAPSW